MSRTNDKKNRLFADPVAFLAFILFVLTVPIANWLIGNVGTECIPNGPCLLPVGFGLYAPSGVLVIGLSLVLRDWLHELGGLKVVIPAIFLGGLIAWFVSPPFLVMASVFAYLLAEFSDLAVYSPLRKRGLYLAVITSGLVGSLVDSFLFQLIAFSTTDFVAGQTLGKFWMTLLALPVIFMFHKWFKTKNIVFYEVKE